MEDAGIITRYHAEVNLVKQGFPVMALIRMTSLARSGPFATASCKDFVLARTPREIDSELKKLFEGKHGEKSMIEQRAEWAVGCLADKVALLEARQ